MTIIDRQENKNSFESKLQYVIESLLDCFGICTAIRDSEGEIIDFLIEYINNTAFGCMPKDKSYVGSRLLEVLPGCIDTVLYNEFKTIVETGKPFSKKIVNYEDKENRVNITGAYDIRAIRVGDGLALTWRDITCQMKMQEKELQNKKLISDVEEGIKRLEDIVKSSDDAIIEENTEGIITSWNQGAEKIFGYRAEEVLGRYILSVIPVERQQEMQEFIQKVRNGERITHYETACKRKDGASIYVYLTVYPIFNLNMKIIGVSTIARDITICKNLERTARESEERYRTLIDFLPFGVFVHQNEKLIFVNSSGIKILGLTNPNDIIGKSMKELIDLEHSSVIPEYKRLIESGNGETVSNETVIVRKDGSLVDVEIVSTKLTYGDITSILSVIKDTTAEKKADALQKEVDNLNEVLEYDKLKTEFFTNISHELKTPLNIIFSAIQLLEFLLKGEDMKENGKKIDKLVKVMKQNSFRLLRMINNLIDTTKIDTGFYGLHILNCDIVSLIEDIVVSVAEYVGNKDIKLEFDTDVNGKVIACDPDIIERIILNLLSNAVKFTKSKGLIAVKIRSGEEFISISVKDNGIGIEKDNQNIIFERFRQVDKSLTRSCEGSGIGLALVKSLVEMHGGDINVISEYGRGSEFIVRLPVKLLDNIDSGDSRRRNEAVSSKDDRIEKIHIEFSDIYFKKF